MKIYVLVVSVLTLLYSATPEQVEEYLSVSNAEEQLLDIEQQYASMQKSFGENNQSELYDMQLLSIRFKEYLQKNLSEDEMDEILKVYKNLLVLRFASATAEDFSPKDIEAYLSKLHEDPTAKERTDIVTSIAKHFFSEEKTQIIFDELIVPLYKNGMGGDSIDKTFLESSKKNYLEMTHEAGINELLYATRDFSIEELETLDEILKSSAVDKEVKAVYGAIAYALKDFFKLLSKRFNSIKHQQYTLPETNTTKR